MLNVHYELVQIVEGVPVAIVYGDIACGKSKILDSCLSMMGTADSDHSVKNCPDGQFTNLSSRTTLGIVYDDDVPACLSDKIMSVRSNVCSIPRKDDQTKDIISLGGALEDALLTEMPDVTAKVRAILPFEVPNRVQKLYSWLMLATLKVHYSNVWYCIARGEFWQILSAAPISTII